MRTRPSIPTIESEQIDPSAETAAETREAFLAVVTHELRNPLAGLHLAAQLLLRELDTREEENLGRSRVLAQSIVAQSNKVSRLITYLYEVSRTGAASPAMDIQETDLVALAVETVETAQRLVARQPIQIIAPRAVLAAVDPARIEEVLLNLLDNAIKYSPEDGPIIVELNEPDPGTVEIVVRDHGVGVADDQRAHMFDLFSLSHDPHQEGSGLGLYLSRRIVELHRGELTAEFPADGGTRMVVSLPRGESMSSQRSAQPSMEPHQI